MAEIKLVHVPGQKPIRILKWLVKKGDRIKHGTPLALYRTVEEPKKHNEVKEMQLKSKHVGTIKMFLMHEGQVAIPEGVLLEIEGCAHPVVMKDLCAECGQDLRPSDEENAKRVKQKMHSATVSMIPSIPELKISAEQAEQIAQQDKNRLHQMRKLVLLVDLDQTLIHTTQDPGLAALFPQNDDFYSFQLGKNDPTLFTKLRPHCREFLQEVSRRYELQIVTFGSRQYAHKIADFIDKEKKHFAHRILSRDECMHPFKKSGNLRHLFPCGDSMVCIIDDRDDVWNAVPNLIVVKKYTYFQGTGDLNNPYKIKGAEKLPVTAAENAESDSQFRRKRKSEELVRDKDSDLKRLKDDVTVTQKETSDGLSQLDSHENKIQPGEEQDKIDDDLIISSDSDSSSDTSSDSSSSESSNSDDGNKQQTELSQSQETEVDEKMAEIAVKNKDVKKTEKKKNFENETENSGIETESYVKISSTKNGLNESSESTASTIENEATSSRTIEDKATSSDKVNGENPGTDSSSGETCPISSQGSDFREKSSQELLNREVSGFSGPSQEFTSISSHVTADDNYQDTDDYLHYLKDVLVQIHNTYYEAYDKFLTKEFKDLPDVRGVVPFLRSKVLYGCYIVFTGIIPTSFHLPWHMHRAHVIARQLGARVEDQVTDKTTHLIAAKKGTTKHQDAQKRKKQKVKMVSVEWLWCCSERWDKVEEKLFPVPDKYIDATKTQPAKPTPMEVSQPEHITDPRPVNIPPPANTYDSVTGKLIKKVQDPRFNFMVAESQQRRLDEQHQVPLYSSLKVPNAVIPVVPGNANPDSKSGGERRKIHPSLRKHNPLAKSNTSPGRRTRKRSMAEIVGFRYSLSTDDIADMDKEVDDLLESSDDDVVVKESSGVKIEEDPCPVDEDSQPTTSKNSSRRNQKREDFGTMIEEEIGDSPAPHLELVKEEKESSEEEGGEESSEDDEMEALLNAEMHYDEQDDN